ncbi:MAG: IclR family transcriptional regulator [Lachnospiraceae bacterium]|nr:IclR family transcriptional regulator [Lachnospiraceae bacterium]
MKEQNTSVLINSVNRTLDILEYLFRVGGEVSISQISKELGLYKSTVYRSLATLQNRGYVKQNPANDCYSLGIKTFILGSGARIESELEQTVHPYMQQLNDRFHESVNLSVLTRDVDGVYKSVILSKVDSKLSLSAYTNIGSLNECYCCAVGKCLLTFSDSIDLDVYREHPLERFTDTTITSVEALRAELDTVRMQGYAIDNEEREIGLYCIGAPILQNGVAVAAISLSGPTARMCGSDQAERIEYIRQLSAEISQAVSI